MVYITASSSKVLISDYLFSKLQDIFLNEFCLELCQFIEKIIRRGPQITIYDYKGGLFDIEPAYSHVQCMTEDRYVVVIVFKIEIGKMETLYQQPKILFLIRRCEKIHGVGITT